MTSDHREKIDELANDLDELKTTADELDSDPPAALEPKNCRQAQARHRHGE